MKGLPALPWSPAHPSKPMAPRSFFLQVKPCFGALIKLAYRFKRKPRPPSPTTSLIILSGSDTVQDDSLNEKEYSIVVSFDPDVWLEILSYCEVVDIIRVGMTCHSLASVTEDRRVWRTALLRISQDNRLPYLRLRMGSLPDTALRQKAILSARLDRLPGGLSQPPVYYTSTRVSLPVLYVWGISFIPGGEWLVVLCRKAGESGVMICRAGDPLGQPSTYSAMPDGQLTMCLCTNDAGVLAMVLGSDGPSGTTLSVYLIHLCGDYPPRLGRVWSSRVQEMENFTSLGSYIVYGWIDRSHTKPRHVIKVLKFDSFYCKPTQHSVMKVVWDTAKYNHSYALRSTDSGITVIVSSTSLVAAYNAPPMVSASTSCKLTHVEPFWQFPCRHMKPHGVYLVPSLPAIDTPSIIIVYRDRCLLILPSFDSDPPGIHPTYFTTYKYPRDMKRPMLLGPQRAFWDLGNGRVGIGPLPTPTYPGFDEHGTWDITGVNVPEANFADVVHPVLFAESRSRKVARAAWDEESGKLALFPNVEFQQGEVMSIVVVDFMH